VGWVAKYRCFDAPHDRLVHLNTVFLEAMQKMEKLDLAALQATFDGRSA
jgi:hypothetical protein